MNHAQAASLLRRIAYASRLPDSFDVRLAEVCADFLNDEEAKQTLRDVKQRHRILVANEPTQEGGAK